MRRYLLAIVGAIIISGGLMNSPEAAGRGPLRGGISADWDYRPDVVIVKFRDYDNSPDKSSTAEMLLTANGAVSREPLFRHFKVLPSKDNKVPDLRTVYLVHLLPGRDVRATAAVLDADLLVEYAEPDWLVPADVYTPNDPRYSDQHQFPQVDAPEAWDVAPHGNNTVVVGILDTGVDWDHPDLAANIWENTGEIAGNGLDDDGNGYIDDIRGWDFVTGITPGSGSNDPCSCDDLSTPDNNPDDVVGHGTHVAGIVGAVTDNGVGVASVSFGVSLMPLRVGFATNSGGGSGYVSWMSQAFVYAGDNGAHAANLSFGNSETVLTGAKYAFQNGVVITGSAGNNDDEIPSALETAFWALGVAAVNKDDQKAYYSSYGTWVDVSAPGGEQAYAHDPDGILSTVAIGSPFSGGLSYDYFQGTSMAAPMVAGLAGLIKSNDTTMTAADIIFQIVGTTDPIDYLNPGYQGKLGSGRINAHRAVTETVTPEPNLILVSVAIDDSAGGNDNGGLEAGEDAEIVVTLRNTWGDASGITASLSTDDWAITVSDGAASIPDIPGLSDIDNNTGGNSADPFAISVNTEAIPHTAKFRLEISTSTGYVDTFDIRLPIFQLILFVDDDDGTMNVEDYYFDAMDALNVGYAVHDRALNEAPPSSLAGYPIVIWGCEWAFPSLDATDRSLIGSYLNSGGRLLVGGQDIGWDLNDPAGGYPNEYNTSGGQSKIWYETYLKSNYVADAANTSVLVGDPGDPIGDGITFSRYQPGRAGDQQFPSEISPRMGASAVFRYSGSPGRPGAVRHDGTWSVVNFAFGGLESITNDDIRREVLRKSIDYLGGLSVDFDKLGDTEEITDYDINATIATSANLNSVDLYWDIDGEFPFNKIIMDEQSPGQYYSQIPAQNPAGERISYFVLTFTDEGIYNGVDIHSFYAGPDTVRPVLELVEKQENTINLTGPFEAAFRASDNIGIDETTALVHFTINGGSEQTESMPLVNGEFRGQFSPPSQLSLGDIVDFRFTVNDSSSNTNEGRLPYTGTYAFEITEIEFVEGFEDGTDDWDMGTIWSLNASAHEGAYSAATGSYPNNTDDALLYLGSFDFSLHDASGIIFWAKHQIDPSDACLIEASADGVNWTTAGSITGASGWKQHGASFEGFSGPGYEDVRFRFRMVSDSIVTGIGIFIDDVSVAVGTAVGIDDRGALSLPEEFALDQNYPNPFNPSSHITYRISEPSRVRLTVYNLLGQEVMEMVDRRELAGTYTVRWDGANATGTQVASGVYFYRLEAAPVSGGETFHAMKKMLLLR